MTSQPTMAQARRSQADDGLTCRSSDHILWTRCNTAEAVPGVMTPLTWSFYTYPVEVGLRAGTYDLGLIPASARRFPDDADERLLGSFHGRFTVNVNASRKVFGAMPGLTADDVERDLLGSVRTEVADGTFPRRGPALLTRIPYVVLTWRGEPRRHLYATRQFWRQSVGPDGLRPGLRPEAVLWETLERCTVMPRYQVKMRMLLQAVTARLRRLAEEAGDPSAVGALLAGAAGTEESAFADDLHRVAHGVLSLDHFVADHGYQGPNSGLPDARSWREDRRPLERLLAALADAEAPWARRARAGAERDRVAADLVASLPSRSRAHARILIRLVPVAARGLQMMKTSKLLAVDASRAAARTLGAQLADAGALADPEDVFFLFADELMSARGQDLRDLVAARRARHERFRATELPETWKGTPMPIARVDGEDTEAGNVSGLGVSSGVVQGRVRVIMNPADDIQVDPGDILVCPATDPSWVSLMMIASALVIDIGAAVSHGAIIARELGLACVIGTGTGTRILRDGDLVRVDGTAGTVEILERSQELEPR